MLIACIGLAHYPVHKQWCQIAEMKGAAVSHVQHHLKTQAMSRIEDPESRFYA